VNWAFFVLRFAAGFSILTLFFLSQRFWHRGIWRVTADFSSKSWRIAVRLAWLALLVLIAFTFVDNVRLGHRHLIPRGTFMSALLGLWFFSALFAFFAIKIVRGVELVWSWLRHRMKTAATQPIAQSLQSQDAAVTELLADPSRRYFFRAVTAAAGAAPFICAMYGYSAERLDYHIHNVEIPIPDLPAGLEGMRIVQLSDIHLSGYMPRSEVRRAVEMANELTADLAVITGDFITGASDPLAECVEELRMLRVPLGVWGCNGNHEIYAKAEHAAQSLFSQAGMKLLRQQSAQLNFKGAQFNLIGVDYQRERTNEGHRQQTLGGLDALIRRDMPNILLSHNPNSFPRAAELGIQLSLAGHTHGGQIQVEILDHRLSPARFMTDYVAGLYQRPMFAPFSNPDVVASSRKPYAEAPKIAAAANATAGMASIYVNRGLGTVGAPVRLGVPPEITLLVLRRA
jgi:predicted MPP superfamily phosphohydrolase